MSQTPRLAKLIATAAMIVASGTLILAPTAAAQEHLVESCPTDNPGATVAWCVYVDANQDTNYTKVHYPTGIGTEVQEYCPVNPFCFEVPFAYPTWGQLNEPGGSSYGHVRVGDTYVRYSTDVGSCGPEVSAILCAAVPWIPTDPPVTTA